MFQQTFLTPPNKTAAFCTAAASGIFQTLLVGLAILVPLLKPETLPRALIVAGIMSPSPPPPPPPAGPCCAVKIVDVKYVPRQFDGSKLVAPLRIPAKAAVIDDAGLPPLSGFATSVGVPGGIGVPSGSWDRFASGLGSLDPPAPPPPPPPPAEPPRRPPERIKVGGRVQEAMILRRVLPVYPPLARQARVAGVVRLLGIIAADGGVRELQVLEGHPLLVPAALDAVRQWRYRPTLLNGEPVEVIAPIEVRFTLSQ
ncbi:MAG: energy transducer TonB [Bryobacteraceae bacterium]|nr:energy transducer TonB [Bryobacteraceae bacterium]